MLSGLRSVLVLSASLTVGAYAAAPAAEGEKKTPGNQDVSLPRDLLEEPEDVESWKSVKRWLHSRVDYERFNDFHRQRLDWEEKVVTILTEYVSLRKSPAWKSQKRTDHFRRVVLSERARMAISLAQLLRMKAAVPALKAVAQAGAEDNTYVRETMRALHVIGVKDEYWVECFNSESAYIACVAICEVWDSDSEKIQAAIEELRKKIKAQKKVDLGRGAPLALLQVVRNMENPVARYEKATLPEQLLLVENALRGGFWGPGPFGGPWYYTEFDTMDLSSFKYVTIRWGGKRLHELSRQHPEAVVIYILALPNRETEGLKIGREHLAVYRTYLMQWATPRVRREIEKRLAARATDKTDEP